jgi:hypothetical protein
MSFALLSRKSEASPVTAAPQVVRQGLNSPGRPLDTETRSVAEPRFGHDFAKVQVHAGSTAAESARSVNALAYTVGNHIVFGDGQYNPGTDRGRHLLVHELTHVAQQAGSRETTGGLQLAGPREEREADVASLRVLSGQRASISQRTQGPALARFSDTTHHVIEEAALPGAGFTPDQVKSIEKGNVQRDYSQVGAAGNAALLGQAKDFGGYKTYEHFDNFIFDVKTDKWRTRGAGQNKFLHLDPKEPDTSPIDYISNQLGELASVGIKDDGGLVHLGNAFHTVEDFFAHSNFIELTQQNLSFGKDLVTGSFEDNPANSAVSLAHTLGAVSTPQMRAYYDQQAEANTALTEPRSHSRLAKDTASSAGFTEARRLAALVIQELGADVISAMSKPTPELRTQAMNDTVLVKIRQYLRPPDPKDPWWERLASKGATSIDARLAEAAGRTPVTVNQAPFSPLRNLEASKDSPLAIPLGLAAPLGGNAFLQAGAGVTRPGVLDPRLTDAPTHSDERALPFLGAQITGHF